MDERKREAEGSIGDEVGIKGRRWDRRGGGGEKRHGKL